MFRTENKIDAQQREQLFQLFTESAREVSILKYS